MATDFSHGVAFSSNVDIIPPDPSVILSPPSTALVTSLNIFFMKPILSSLLF
eukprot:CAMPEP_0170800862 /NCGR_PEP_ID=MMETSP0733-20121128/28134_1 /TAXON_ID=186038 /ORGANISM="Fragilariopsis kerguelensis, Strain L26-C5" /LENGTH=51 /DNA_ID=CAMNT_0011153347 /DNA_START=20 /DNA_END=172 /DNA_ORIENTATION=+